MSSFPLARRDQYLSPDPADVSSFISPDLRLSPRLCFSGRCNQYWRYDLVSVEPQSQAGDGHVDWTQSGHPQWNRPRIVWRCPVCSSTQSDVWHLRQPLVRLSYRNKHDLLAALRQKRSDLPHISRRTNEDDAHINKSPDGVRCSSRISPGRSVGHCFGLRTTDANF